MSQIRIFVCGAMASDGIQFKKIEQLVINLQNASTKGSIFKLESGFHVFIHGGTQKILGQVITINAGELRLNFLDALFGYNPIDPEKSLNIRHEIVAYIDGIAESVFVYAYNPKKLTKKATEIPEELFSNDTFLNPPLYEELSETERNYLVKIAALTGRDSIPINDMGLYRSLMKKELIVDKGRRLALSKLGQELVNYLL